MKSKKCLIIDKWFFLCGDDLREAGDVLKGDIAGRLFKADDNKYGVSVVQVIQKYEYQNLFRMNFFTEDKQSTEKELLTFIEQSCKKMREIVSDYLRQRPQARLQKSDVERCNLLMEKCLEMLDLRK